MKPVKYGGKICQEYGYSISVIHSDSMKIQITRSWPVLLVCGFCLVPVFAGEASSASYFWQDPLTDGVTAEVAMARTNRGGRFEREGWRVLDPRGFLRITLPEGVVAEGRLEVKVSGLNLAGLGAEIGPDRKVHFINFFSNANGDHHVEDGGSANDALWTLRVGTDAAGGPRYGRDLKLLWASRGAKRAPGSDYEEVIMSFPSDWHWEAAQTYAFAIDWSQSTRRLTVWVNHRIVAQVPWLEDGAPLRHVFLGGTPDFHAFTGAVFSDLRISSGPAEAANPH